jgi:hypothetical protein
VRHVSHIHNVCACRKDGSVERSGASSTSSTLRFIYALIDDLHLQLTDEDEGQLYSERPLVDMRARGTQMTIAGVPLTSIRLVMETMNVRADVPGGMRGSSWGEGMEATDVSTSTGPQFAVRYGPSSRWSQAGVSALSHYAHMVASRLKMTLSSGVLERLSMFALDYVKEQQSLPLLIQVRECELKLVGEVVQLPSWMLTRVNKPSTSSKGSEATAPVSALSKSLELPVLEQRDRSETLASPSDGMGVSEVRESSQAAHPPVDDMTRSSFLERSVTTMHVVGLGLFRDDSEVMRVMSLEALGSLLGPKTGDTGPVRSG